MAHFNKLFFIGFLLLFMGFGCGTSDKPGQEPNDTILEADPIKLGKAVKMRIDSTHDRDWYRVIIPDKGYLKLGAKDVPGDIKPEVKFAEKQPWKNKKHNWYTGWSRLPEATQLHKRDTIYFAIQDNNQNARSPKQFAIKAQFKKEFDDHELNNEVKNAKEQGLGNTITSYIYPIEDQDWFQFNAEKEGYLWVKEKSSPDDVKTEVKFAKKDDMTEEMEELSNNCRVPCAIRISEKGTYYIRIQDNNNNAASTDPVKWKTDYLKEMDTTEPNNETAKAHPAFIGDTLSIAIFPQGDHDYVKLTPEKKQEIYVKANANGDIEPGMRLFRKDGMETKRMTNRKKLPHKIELEKGETYFIEFRDYNDNNRSPKPFPVMILENPGA